MSNQILSTLFATPALFGVLVAHAAHTAKEEKMEPKGDSMASSVMIKQNGFIQSSSVLTNSQDKNTLPTIGNYLRYGVTAVGENNASAGLELDFTQGATGAKYGSYPTNVSTAIRKAYIGFSNGCAKTMETNHFALKFGRIVPKTPEIYITPASPILEGDLLDSVDGIAFNTAIPFGKVKAHAQVYLANAASNAGDNAYGLAPAPTNRAFGVAAKVEASGIVGEVAYQGQTNSIVRGSTDTIQNKQFIIVSAGYKAIENLKAGAFYRMEDFGKKSSYTISNGSVKKDNTGNIPTASLSSNTFGLGVDTKSALYGVGSLLAKDDGINAGVSYSITTNKWTVDSIPNIPNTILNLNATETMNNLGFYVGYSLGNASINLAYNLNSNNNKVYKDSSGKETDSASTLSLVARYEVP